MPRGRKRYSLDEKIASLLELTAVREKELEELKNELKTLRRQKEQTELSELNKLLKESGRTAAELVAFLKEREAAAEHPEKSPEP
ncbi:MAG TPA: hypothetical protein H9672_08330 [Firmicutes bacterium]|nr:hypothetical protein [Bacillota bacterium]